MLSDCEAQREAEGGGGGVLLKMEEKNDMEKSQKKNARLHVQSSPVHTGIANNKTKKVELNGDMRRNLA